VADDTNTIPPYVFEQRGTFDAPFTYTIPGSLEIRPDTASAFFDGTSASGDFLACLTWYSPEGSLLTRQFNPTPVKAGDSAFVSYVPPFGSAASSSSTGAGTITEIDSPLGTINVTNPTGPIVDIDVAFTIQNEVVTASPLTVNAGATGLFSLSHSSGDTLLKYTAPGSATHPLIIHGGLYILSISVDVQTVTTNPDYTYLALGTAGSFPRQAWTMFNNTGGPSESTLTGTRVCVSGDDASVAVFNQSANNYTYHLDSYVVTRLTA
jgi:hypothetical protein